MSEQSLVTTLLGSEVHFPWKSSHEILHLTEVKITTNRVDVVYFEKKSDNEIGSMMAIEAKLKDWRRALQQAHRDKLFADRAYVVLPEKYSAAAIENLDQFRRASVGLMIVCDDGVKTYYHPPRNTDRSKEHVNRAMQALSIAI